MDHSIAVAIRVRPLLPREQGDVKWRVDGSKIITPTLPGVPGFEFDHVFGESVTTNVIHSTITCPIVHSVMEGFNGTVFAYGQTSSGKTFTMMGTESQPGVTPLAIQEVFDYIEEHEELEFIVRVSYLEIYKEGIVDLLDPSSTELRTREDRDNNVRVHGLKEYVVTCIEEVMRAILYGNINRTTGETNMNERSSRSHAVLCLAIESRVKGGDNTVKVSSLNLVDLAGSERLNATGAVGRRAQEGIAINKSLFTLKQVISKLSEGNPSIHVPYRDSKLTHILKPSLGGNAKTAIICAVTPAEGYETELTLKFASCARKVKNRPIVNEVLGGEEALMKKLKEFERENEELKKKLISSESTLTEENRKELVLQISEKEEMQAKLEAKVHSLQEIIINSTQSTQPSKTSVKDRRRTICPASLARGMGSPLLFREGKRPTHTGLHLPTHHSSPAVTPDLMHRSVSHINKQVHFTFDNESFHTVFDNSGFEKELQHTQRLSGDPLELARVHVGDLERRRTLFQHPTFVMDTPASMASCESLSFVTCVDSAQKGAWHMEEETTSLELGLEAVHVMVDAEVQTEEKRVSMSVVGVQTFNSETELNEMDVEVSISVAELQRQAEENEKELEQLKTALRNSETQLSSSVAKLQRQAEEKETELEQLRATLRNSEAERNNMETKLSSVCSELGRETEERKEELEQLKTALRSTEAERNGLETQLSHVSCHLQDLQETSSKLVDLNRSHSCMCHHGNELCPVKMELDEMKTFHDHEHAVRSEEIEEVKETLAKEKSLTLSLEEKVSTFQKKISDMEMASTAQEEYLMELCEKSKAAKKQQHETEDKCGQLEMKIAHLQEESKGLEEEKRRWREESEGWEEEKRRWREEREGWEEEKRRWREESEGWEEEKRETQEHILVLKEQLQSLQVELEALPACKRRCSEPPPPSISAETELQITVLVEKQQAPPLQLQEIEAARKQEAEEFQLSYQQKCREAQKAQEHICYLQEKLEEANEAAVYEATPILPHPHTPEEIASLKEELGQMEIVLEERNCQVVSLTEERVCLQKQLVLISEDLAASKSTHEHTLSSLEEELEQLRTALRNSEAERNELGTQFSSSVAELQRQVEENEEELEQLRTALRNSETLSSSVAELQKQAEESEEEINQLRAALGNSEAEKCEIEAKISTFSVDLQREVEERKAVQEQLRVALRNSEVDLKEIESKLSNTNSELLREKEEKESIQEQLETLLRKFEMEQNEVEVNLLKSVAELQRQAEEKNIELEQLRTALRNSEAERNGLETHVMISAADFQRQVEENEEELEQLKTALRNSEAQLSSSVAELQKQAEEKETELEQLRATLRNSEAERNRLETIISREERETEEREDDIIQLRTALRNSEADRNEMETQISAILELHTELEQLRTALRISEAEREQITSVCNGLEGEAEERGIEEKAKNEEIQLLKKEVSKFTDDIVQCSEEFLDKEASWNEEKDSLHEKINVLDSLNNTLRAEVSQLQCKITQLEQTKLTQCPVAMAEAERKMHRLIQQNTDMKQQIQAHTTYQPTSAGEIGCDTSGTITSAALYQTRGELARVREEKKRLEGRVAKLRTEIEKRQDAFTKEREECNRYREERNLFRAKYNNLKQKNVDNRPGQTAADLQQSAPQPSLSKPPTQSLPLTPHNPPRRSIFSYQPQNNQKRYQTVTKPSQPVPISTKSNQTTTITLNPVEPSTETVSTVTSLPPPVSSSAHGQQKHISLNSFGKPQTLQPAAYSHQQQQRNTLTTPTSSHAQHNQHPSAFAPASYTHQPHTSTVGPASYTHQPHTSTVGPASYTHQQRQSTLVSGGGAIVNENDDHLSDSMWDATVIQTKEQNNQLHTSTGRFGGRREQDKCSQQ